MQHNYFKSNVHFNSVFNNKSITFYGIKYYHRFSTTTYAHTSIIVYAEDIEIASFGQQ